ncbi:MAG TPA: hypothetical protein VHP14_13800 [Anaerolineales bacterium]|nr:hypothetical protein [Anaerolineales bacterium]
MASSIQLISEKRARWIEANRENGFEEGLKNLLSDLYPDSTHFIYELLQNAEDAKASKVQFFLRHDSVEVEHNGERLFSIEDVEAITSIGVSTKKNDTTSIGKFGVGFKSVYAYTSTPEIHSGEYHFRIHDLVVPDENNVPKIPLGETCTRFLFPFNNCRKPKEVARREIERNLRKLRENTLLFLRNIKRIEYHLPNSSKGILEREENGKHWIKISVQTPEDIAPVSTVFLRFEETVSVLDNEEKKSKSCRISVAFGIETDMIPEKERRVPYNEEKQIPCWKIRPLDPGEVSIYFPAIKETSNLRFHLHAPFASTVARDSVRDCPANNRLRDHLANLVAGSMITVRDQGLLNVEFLGILPNFTDNLPEFYQPIQDRLVKVFQVENLTPMKQGGHAAASGIYKGETRLSNLIDDEDLCKIKGKNQISPMWAANPPQRYQREDRFLSSLNIKEWTVKDLIEVLCPDKLTPTWINGKPEAWFQQLYTLLDDLMKDSELSRIRNCRIVRIIDGSCRMGKESYFPSSAIENGDMFPLVAKGVYTSSKINLQNEKAKKFLDRIGVREVDETLQIETILKKRYSQQAGIRGTLKPDIRDIVRFIALVEKDPLKARLFSNYCIFKRQDGRWGTPHDVYLDAPFILTELTAYHSGLGRDALKFALSTSYRNLHEIKTERFVKFAKLVGVQTELEIIEIFISNDNPEYRYLMGASGERLINPINRDYVIPRFKVFITNPNLSKSRLVWNRMCFLPSEPNYLQAMFRKNESHDPRVASSQLVHDLKSAKWIPQENGDTITFVKPCEALAERLPKVGFPYKPHQKWLEVIEFGASARRQSEEHKILDQQAKRIGFSSADEAEKFGELAQFVKKHGLSSQELITQMKSVVENRHGFPQKPVLDTERRQEKTREQLNDSPDKEYEERLRSVRTTRESIDPTTQLREHYTDEAGEMRCQICGKTMPFKDRSGKYYFEAVEAFPAEYFAKEHESQFLALCPTCAAMYKVFVKRDKSASQALYNKLKASKALNIPLHLDQWRFLQFVEPHFLTIKAILENVK